MVHIEPFKLYDLYGIHFYCGPMAPLNFLTTGFAFLTCESEKQILWLTDFGSHWFTYVDYDNVCGPL